MAMASSTDAGSLAAERVGFAGQLLVDESPPRSDGDSPNPFRGPAQSTKSVKYRYSATGKHLSSPLKGSPSSPDRSNQLSPALPTTSRKRKPSPGLRASASLSPLSTPPSSPLQLEPKKNVVPLRPLGPTASQFTVRSPRKKHKRPKTTHLDPCRIGTSLWVLVNHLGILADNAPRSDASQDLVWWPAQIVQKHPLRVSLFGDFPSSSSTSSGLCTIFDPLPSNVLPILDHDGAKRFSPSSFRLAPTAHADDALLAKWQSAVQSMDKASTLEQEGLPALLSSYATAGGTFHDSPDESESDRMSDLRPSLRKSTASARKNPKRSDATPKLKLRRSKPSLTLSAPRHWSPCPPDPTLQIPGELIFALAPRTGGFYWPAQIIEHVPARHERYKIKFLDEKEYTLTRDKFWTSEQEGFVRCTLGEWESAVNSTDDPESEDDDVAFGPDDDETATGPDDATPPLPPPPPPIEFQQLSVRRQLAYVKPVLRAILINDYHPARERHHAFMKGGSARASLLKSAGVRGGMDARFVNAVQKAICRWVLGDNPLRADRLDTEDVLNPSEQTAMPSDVAPPAVQTDVRTDNHDATSNPAPLSTDQSAQDSAMVVDGQDQSVPPVNGAAPSPQVQQAKSQLDLLAEVSQAVATKPSLLPSHPEIPNLNLTLPPEESSSHPSPLTPIPEEDPQIAPRKTGPVVCEEFEMLSRVEKLDYCLNVLLPESVQQLLLWRSGERTSAALVSPEEEQKMHDTGVRKAMETDWVEDLMKLRAAQARLWGVDLNKNTANAAEVVGGTRSRPRWGTVSRP